MTKLLFDDSPEAHGHGKILGGGMVATHAGDIIVEIALAPTTRATLLCADGVFQVKWENDFVDGEPPSARTGLAFAINRALFCPLIQS